MPISLGFAKTSPTYHFTARQNYSPYSIHEAAYATASSLGQIYQLFGFGVIELHHIRDIIELSTLAAHGN